MATKRIFVLATLLTLGSAGFVSAQGTRAFYNPDWSIPAEPVQLADQLYQVGTATLTSFLITSDEGHILIDVPLDENVDLVLANVRELGFDPDDIEILLGSQAHYDHVGGFASMMEATGAELWLSELDGDLVARGGRGDFFLGDEALFRPAQPTRTIGHLETVSLGDRTLTAHLTPGHTKGCTTWSGEFTIDDRPATFVSICSLTAHPGYRLVGTDPSYPGIARDFCESIEHLRTLSPEIFASTHTAWFSLEEKARAREAGDRDAFVDPEGYVAFLDDSARAIDAKLAEQGEPGGCGAILAAEPVSNTVEPEQVREWLVELSNWGRWGAEDELGTLNLITDEKRAAAARLVTDGVAVSLSRDVDKERAADNPSPIEHEVSWNEGEAAFSGDSYAIQYHGFSYSHIDALAHTAVDGRMYNGFSTETVPTTGAERLGIENAGGGIFTRGVLIDLPRLRGVPYLEPGTAVMASELEAWERETGVRIRPGDVLLIRTGRWVKRAEDGPWGIGEGLAGLHVSTAEWLRSRDIAAIGCDGVTDALPSGVDGWPFPLHHLLLVAMGTPIFDNLDLDELAEEAAARGRWTFLFTAAPMRIPGGLGSPVNPTAVF